MFQVCRAILVFLLALSLPPIAMAAQDDVQFRKQYVDSRYGQIHVLTSGPTHENDPKTPVACFAPNPSSGNYYRMFMAELGKDRVMIAPDYPGLGASDAADDYIDMAGYAGVMADALVELGYGEHKSRKIDVCGYHTGAMVALELAIQRPDLVRKVMIAGIPYYNAEERKKEYEETVVAKVLKEDLDSLSETWTFAVQDRQDGVSLERAFDNFTDIIRAKNKSHYAYHAVFTYPAEERGPLVKQSVLVLNTHGSLKDETRAMMDFLPTGTIIDIPELHHGVFDVGAARLAQHSRAFFDAD